jgi:hypothetical protein
MAGLDPAIHVFVARGKKDVDARLKAGHDELKGSRQPLTAPQPRMLLRLELRHRQ